jgi:hypothetical protein
MRVRRPYSLQVTAPEIGTVSYQRGDSAPIPPHLAIMVGAVHNH